MTEGKLETEKPGVSERSPALGLKAYVLGFWAKAPDTCSLDDQGRLVRKTALTGLWLSVERRRLIFIVIRDGGLTRHVCLVRG